MIMNEDPTETEASPLVPVEFTNEEIEYLSVLVAHDVNLDRAYSPRTADRHKPVLSKLLQALRLESSL